MSFPAPGSRSPTVRQLLDGKRLSPSETAEWRLSLPTAPPRWLLEELQRVPLLGSGLVVTAVTGMRDDERSENEPLRIVELTMRFFDAHRVLSEALEHPTGRALLAAGYLALAGCGRRGTALYAVACGGPLEGHLFRCTAHEAPEACGVRLCDVKKRARACPEASLRQRLKAPKRRKAHVSSSKRGKPAAAVAAKKSTSAERTLSLFGTQLAS